SVGHIVGFSRTVQNIKNSLADIGGDIRRLSPVFHLHQCVRRDGVDGDACMKLADVDSAQTLFMGSDGMNIQSGGAGCQKRVFTFLRSTARMRCSAVERNVQLSVAEEILAAAADRVRRKRTVFRTQ